jgi:hypothetical protein
LTWSIIDRQTDLSERSQQAASISKQNRVFCTIDNNGEVPSRVRTAENIANDGHLSGAISVGWISGEPIKPRASHNLHMSGKWSVFSPAHHS